jgi:hypothetical protein
MSLRRLLSLTLALSLVACRPDVEARALCTLLGDDGCPSGHHCGEDGRCAPGEAPVRVSWSLPEGEVLSGPIAPIQATARHPDGIGAVQLLVLADEAERARLTPVTTPGDDPLHELRLSATVDTTALADGHYRLALESRTAADSPRPSTPSLAVRIHNGDRPALEIEAPRSGQEVPAVIAVRGEVASARPLRRVTLRLAGVVAPAEPVEAGGRWKEGTRLGGSFTGQLAAPTGANELLLVVAAEDDQGSTIEREVPLRVRP